VIGLSAVAGVLGEREEFMPAYAEMSAVRAQDAADEVKQRAFAVAARGVQKEPFTGRHDETRDVQAGHGMPRPVECQVGDLDGVSGHAPVAYQAMTACLADRRAAPWPAGMARRASIR